jgi:ribosome biogenesis GTPase
LSETDLIEWGADAGAAAAWADAAARPGCVIGRVIEEHLGGLWVRTQAGAVLARSAGRLRRGQAHDPTRRPAVGDWVLVEPGDGDRATLHDTWPRRTALVRRAAGARGVAQVVAANVDHVWILCPVATPSPRRAERWLALARAAGARPALIVTKGDLGGAAEAAAALTPVAAAAGAPVHVVAAQTGAGVPALRATVGTGETVVLVGSSGVGKSTLVNALAGGVVRATQDVRADGKGRHTTTTRALVRTGDGLLLLDTPGIRELGLALADDGVDDAFAEIAEVATRCRFRDCHHGPEPGCAVQAAIAAGTLDAARLARFTALSGEDAATTRAMLARFRKEK